MAPDTPFVIVKDDRDWIERRRLYKKMGIKYPVENKPYVKED